jgi:hypothetical protein
MTLEALTNFKLQDSLFGGGGFIVNAAAQPLKIGLIAVLGLLSSGLSVWVAAMAASLFGRSHPFLAWTHFALAAGVLAVLSRLRCSSFCLSRASSRGLSPKWGSLRHHYK